MRVRKVDAAGDMMFGNNQGDYWRDVPDAVGQIVASRLNLWQEEWYLNRTEGTPYATQVLGKRTKSLRDPVLRTRILRTPGVTAIPAYSSALDRSTRALMVSATIDTAYRAQNALGTAVAINQPVYGYR